MTKQAQEPNGEKRYRHRGEGDTIGIKGLKRD